MIKKNIRIAAITLAIIMASSPVCAYASEYGEMEDGTGYEESMDIPVEENVETQENETGGEEAGITTPESTEENAETSGATDEVRDTAEGNADFKETDRESGENDSADGTVTGNEVPESEDTEETEETPAPVKRLGASRTILRNTSNTGDSYYDAREYGLVTPVKSQRYGDCYIYAMTSLAETSMLKNMTGTYTSSTLDLSEKTILEQLFTPTSDPLNLLGSDKAVGSEYSGFNNEALIFKFATNSVPTANDNDEPFYDTAATLKEGYFVNPSRLTRSEFKTLIKRYGAAAAVMPATTKNDSVYFYYSPTTTAQMFTRNQAHAIAIIGWDDNIEASLFENEFHETPSVDGGWLCKNSAGTTFGDSGYFWLSYGDAFFTNTDHDVCFLSMEEPDEWNVYQYDGGTSKSGTTAINAANVFTAKANDNGTETLSRVGASLDSGTYTVEIYKYTDSTKAPWAQSTLLGSTTLTVPDKLEGYSTAYLDNPISLTHGDKFAVCVKRTDGSVFGIGADYSDEHNVTTVNAGESFIRYRSNTLYEDAKTSPYVGPQGANLRIKAFTICNNDGDNTIKYINSASVSGTYTYTGAEIKPDITILDADENPIPNRNCKITYRNNVNAGTATVVITAKNSNVAGRTTTTFRINPKSIAGATVTAANDNLIYSGSAQTPDTVVRVDSVTLSAGTDYTAAFSNNTNAGTAGIAITGKGNYTGTASGSFTIVAAASGNTQIEYPSSIECTGSQIKPPVRISYNGIDLVENTDYTLEYGTNLYPVTGTFTVKYKGNYSGTVNKTFTIAQRDGTKCTISYNMINTYTGGTIKPEVTVNDNGSPLIKGTDYSVGYSNNTEITNNADIVITFMNKYTGTVEKKFSIVPISAEDVTLGTIIGYTDKKYDGNAKTPFIPEATYGYTLTRGSDYTVGYSDNVNAGTGYIVYSFKGHFTGTKRLGFEIEPVGITELTVGNIGTQEYTGSAITPDVSVTWNGTPLTKGTDYRISYENNVDGGTATATITGINNFSGTTTRNFTIHRETQSNPSNPGNRNNDPKNPSNPSNGGNSGGSGNNSNNTSTSENTEKEDPTIKKWTTGSGAYKAEITMKREVPYSRNKSSIASSCGVSFKLLEGSGISVKSVKAKKPKKNASSTTITIKLRGSDKASKRAVKAMNRSLKNISVSLKSSSTTTSSSSSKK